MKTIQVVLVSLFLVFISCGDKTPKEKEVVLPVKKVETTVKVVDEEMKTQPLTFKVQIGAFTVANKKFEMINDVAIVNENGLFKYRLGSFESYKEARSFRRSLLAKYPGAFVQAEKNDTSIQIKEALKQ
jgi:hypothetical protein